MRGTRLDRQWTIVAFAALVEGGTGLVLMIDPAIVIDLLLGAIEQLGGVLLWPGVVLHAGVALALIWTWRSGGRPSHAGR